MHAHIENLVKLQNVDLERARLTQAARALPAEITQAEAALAAAQRQVVAASDALSREESLRTKLDREVADHRKKAARYRAQQDDVRTPEQATAIDHEVHFADSEIERLENEEFASLERTESQEAALASARALVEQMALALDRTRERVAVSQQDLNKQQAALNVDREALRKLIEPEWLTRFDRMSASRGTGIARVDNQMCLGCRMGVRPQMWNQLREGELLSCDSCGRLLYWDPAMAPPPIAAKPEAVPGAGRPVRKSHQAGA